MDWDKLTEGEQLAIGIAVLAMIVAIFTQDEKYLGFYCETRVLVYYTASDWFIYW